jgi:3-methyladenine DNA glycosylase/8-oxoguanine DNA glycosylase
MVIHQNRLDHLPAQQEVIAEKWRPYRSLATSYLFSAAFEPAGLPDLHAAIDYEVDARHV